VRRLYVVNSAIVVSSQPTQVPSVDTRDVALFANAGGETFSKILQTRLF